MVTIVLTNRNRDLQLVKNCFTSLDNQTNDSFEWVVVDYGSTENNLCDLQELVSKYSKIKFISCHTASQLWCKSRAINIVLKKCETSHFFVGDIDMIFHSNFIESLHQLKNKSDATYFQVGFLSETESKKNRAFGDYEISFKSNQEATGMTLYNTKTLKFINGYDEFYNGWGSEDTDVHVRIKNANKKVYFYDSDVFILHQWHPKTYRSKVSTAPFHSNLEKINQKYLAYTESTQKIKSNTKFDWGIYSHEAYKYLNDVNLKFEVSNEFSDIKGFINSVLLCVTGRTVLVTIKTHQDYKAIGQKAKKVLGKKVKSFLPMQEINDLILETIIMNLRNSPYSYIFDKDSQEISLTIKL